jgi:hypothetical protein
VLERYSPYETLLEVMTPEGLNDTSLAAAFPLHTASPSASSHRLHEIAEDGEDQGPLSSRSGSQSTTASVFGTQRYKMEKRVEQLMSIDRPRRQTPSIHVTNDSISSMASTVSSPRKTLSSQFLVREDSGQRSITSLNTQDTFATMTDYTEVEAPRKSLETSSIDGRRSSERPIPPEQVQELRKSQAVAGASERPATAGQLNHDASARSIDQPSIPERSSMSERSKKFDDDDLGIDWSKFEPKPKVKLGPRPVVAGEKTKRPTVASISSLPAAFRTSSQRKQEPARTPSRPKSQTALNAAVTLPAVLPAPPPIPEIPEYNPRPVSRGSVKSMPSHKSTVMTPDKIRLMKAVELRKKQLRKSNPTPSSFVPPKHEDVPAVPKAPEIHIKAPQQDEKPIAPPPQPPPEPVLQVREELSSPSSPSKKADSGIEMVYDEHEKGRRRSSDDESRVEEPEPPSAEPEEQAKPEERKSADDAEASPVFQEPTFSLDMLNDPTPPGVEESVPPGAPAVEPLDLPPVPTIVMADGSRPVSGSGMPAPEPNNAAEDSDGSAMPDVPSSRTDTDLARRRRGIVEPLHIDPNGELSSDDELLEELQSATVQEATFAKSPIVSTFMRRPSAQSILSEKSNSSVRSINIRKSSMPIVDSPALDSPFTSLPDTAGHSQLVRPPLAEGSEVRYSLKRNVSDGISRRIHALAASSSRETSPSGTPRATSPETVMQSTWRDRKSSVRSPPRSRRGSFQRSNSRMSSHGGQSSQPSDATWSVQHDPVSNRNSVSVSARIVRTTIVAEPEEMLEADGPLHQPRVVVSPSRSPPSKPLSPKLPPLNTNPFPQAQRQDSTTAPNASPALGPGEYRSMHSSQNKGFGRHKYSASQTLSPATPSPDDFPEPPLRATTSRTSVEETAPAPAKEGSRTSRFFKRMSHLGGGNKRRSGMQQQQTGASPSTTDVRGGAQRTASIVTAGSKSDMPPAVLVGNLNIQFPDTLVSHHIHLSHEVLIP